MPYSRGLLVICYVVVDYGNPKTVCRPSHANMTEAVRGGAANSAPGNILAGVTSVHDRRSSKGLRL